MCHINKMKDKDQIIFSTGAEKAFNRILFAFMTKM